MLARRGLPIVLPLLLVVSSGCPPGPHSKAYEGTSEAERKLLAESQRGVYPNDVRAQPERYTKATLAWPGIVRTVVPAPRDPAWAQVVIAHHYWDWIEDHSIQKAKAFLSARGEGDFVCHVERRLLPAVDLHDAMAIAYVRPVGVKEGVLHTACLLTFYPPGWYATDVWEYGRDMEGFKVLRVPWE